MDASLRADGTGLGALERAGEVAGSGERAAAPRPVREGSTPSPTPRRPRPDPRSRPELQGSPDGGSGRMPLVLAGSLVVHALAFGALALLPAVSSLSSIEPTIEIFVDDLRPLPEPAPEPAAALPEPEVVAPAPAGALPVLPPTPVPERPRAVARAVEPEPPAVDEAPPPVAAAPPSIDDVFGEPPPPLAAMTAGEGSFAAAAGAGGAAGGVAGAHGHAVGGTGASPQRAAAAGPGADEIRRARRGYAERVRELLGRAARYPIVARREHAEGRVVVALRVDGEGRLIGARVASSCGHASLDEAALAAANELGRLPPPPSLVAWDARDELRIPVVFELR